MARVTDTLAAALTASPRAGRDGSRRRRAAVGLAALVALLCAAPAMAARRSSPPSPPSALSATAGDQTATLSWHASASSNVAGYRIYRTASGTWSSTPVARTSASRLTFTDGGRTDGTTYRYRVTAYNSNGQQSYPSNVASVTPSAPPPPPAPPPSPPPSSGGPDPVIGTAGDISCSPSDGGYAGGKGVSDACRQLDTSNLVVNAGLSAVLPLGDTQYDNGTLSEYQTAYDPTWGRVRSITRPAVGNHEYNTSGASGYFDYFDGVGTATGLAGDRGKGYYSFEIGAWHVVALNSECSEVGGCGAGSPQEQWLKSDLAAHPATCTLAYWHRPLFNSSFTGTDNEMQPIWQDLYAAGADVVLNGHAHDYERFAPQTPSGALDTSRGIRQFVSGTGGEDHHAIASVTANSEVHDSSTFGVLKLTLHPTGYDWQFVPIAGGSFTDSGSATCH